MKIMFTVLCILFCMPGISQSITGHVFDSSTRKPLAMATVTLLNIQNQPVKNVISDNAGRYVFLQMPNGIYTVKVSMTGYVMRRPVVIMINDLSEMKADSFFLVPYTKNLGNITVDSRRALIVPLSDGFRYDASRDIVMGGETAADILRKLPAVIVDGDGIPTIRGSNKIKVFIDNRPSEIYASSVRDALQQISAANIARVDVITHPSAKYDGEGVDAVIQIYTKKPNQDGISGNTSVLVGNRNLQFSADSKWRTGHWIIGMDLGDFYSNNQNQNRNLRTDKAITGNRLMQQTVQDRKNHSTNGGTNFVYTIDSLSWFNVGYRFGIRNDNSFNTISSRVYVKDTLASAFVRNTDTRSERPIHTFSSSYQKSSRDKTTEWSLLGLYFIQTGTEEYTLDQLQGVLKTYQEKNKNTFTNGEGTLQADISKKYTNGSFFEAGLKAVHRDYNNTNEFIPDNFRSGGFHFIFDIMAAYGSVSIPLNKWMLRTGFRYEHTNLSIWFKDTALQINPFRNPLPNILLSRAFANGSSFSFSYSKKLLRPYIVYLNPVVNYTDTFNIRFGNPYLVPEITHNIEATYTYRKKSWFFYGSLFFSRTQNSIQDVSMLKPNRVVENTYRNIAENDVTGLTANLSYQYKKVTVSSNNVLRYMVFNGSSIGIFNRGFVLFSNLQFAYKFSDAFNAGVYGNFNSHRLYLQGSATGWRSITFWANKSFLDKKLNLSLRIDNPFSSYQYIKDENNTPGFYQSGENRVQNFICRLGLSYKFGKKEIKAPNGRSISSEN